MIHSALDWAQAMATICATGGPQGGDLALAELEVMALVHTGTAPPTEVTRWLDSIRTGVIALPDDPQGADLLALAGRLGALLNARLGAARRLAAEARTMLAHLRRDQAELQDTFLATEQFLYDLGGPKLSLCLDTPRAGGGDGADLITLGTDPSAGGARRRTKGIKIGTPLIDVCQHLACSISGLAAIDIFLAKVSGSGRIEAQIHDLSGVLVARTQMPLPPATHPGWHRLRFDTAIAGFAREGGVTLRLVPDRPRTLVMAQLALGTAHPLVHLRAHGPAGPAAAPLSEAPLALRVWRGLPGIRLPAPVHEGTGAPRSRLLGPHEVPQATLLRSDAPIPGAEALEGGAQDDGIVLHPPAQGLSIALIENVPAHSLTRLCALVHNTDPEGPGLRVAITAVPAGAGRLIAPEPLLTSWTAVPPGLWAEVHATPEPITGNADLVIAVMQATGPSTRTGRAVFRGVRLWD